jgi:hypothetical protein
MARNGSGTYVLPVGQPVVTGTTIGSSTFNTLTSDIANALTTSICTDGQTPMAANLPMGNNAITGLKLAAQFDNGTNAASTAFVKAAAQQYSAITSISTNTTLTNTNFGQFIFATAAIVITMPATSAANVTQALTIFNGAAANLVVTIIFQGSDKVIVNQTSITSFVMVPGQSVVMTSIAAGFYAATGNGVARYDDSYSSSLGGSGFQKFPTGLLIQWGQATATVAGVAVSYPTTFASVNALTLGNNTGNISIWTGPLGNAGLFSLFCASSTVTTSWMAIGTSP